MLNPSDFQTRTALDGFSIRYGNEKTDYIADNLFSPVTTPDKDVTKLWQYDARQYVSLNTKKHSKAAADLVDFTGFYTSATLALHKLAAMVDPKDEANADAVVADLEEEAAMRIMDGLLINKEVEAATLATTSGNYPAGLTSSLGATVTWATDGGDPQADAKTARLAVKGVCGRLPNALAISWTTLEHLLVSPALKDQAKFLTGTDRLTEDTIKRALGVQFLFVGKAQKTTAVEGNATQALADIWNDSAIFFVYDPSTRKKMIRYGVQLIRNRLYTYKWLKEDTGSDDGRVKMIEQGWNYVLAAGAVQSSSDTDFAAGYLLQNVY